MELNQTASGKLTDREPYPEILGISNAYDFDISNRRKFSVSFRYKYDASCQCSMIIIITDLNKIFDPSDDFQ